MSCPYCRSHETRKSRSGNRWLFFPLSLIVVRMRCYRCGARFNRIPFVGLVRLPLRLIFRHPTF